MADEPTDSPGTSEGAGDKKSSTLGDAYNWLTGQTEFSKKNIDEQIAQVERLKKGTEELTILEEKRALSAAARLESLRNEEGIQGLIQQRTESIKKIKDREDIISKERVKNLQQEKTELTKIRDAAGGLRGKIDDTLTLRKAELDLLRKQANESRRVGTELQRIEALYSRKIAPGAKKAAGEGLKFSEQVFEAGRLLSDLDPAKLLADAPAENVWLRVLTGVEGVTFGSVYSELDSFTNKMDTGLRSIVKGGVAFSNDMKKVFLSTIDPIEMASGRQGVLVKSMTDNMGGMFVNIGLDGEKAAAAMSAVKNNVSLLRDSFISAGPANMAAAAHIVNLTAGLKHLGVEEVDAAQGFDFFIKGLKQSPKEASKSIRSLENIAHTLDINVGQAFKDFIALQGDLSQYGSRTVEVFGNLQAQSVATGVAVGDLASVADKLDTFKGAATAAQHFNAIVGKSVLSVTDLVHAEPAEKIQLLKEAMDRSNISFDTAHRRIRKMIAGILGVDVAKASKIFGDPDEYFKLQKNLDGSASSMEDLQKRINTSMTNAESMKKTLSSLGVAQMEAVDTARESTVKASETMMGIIGSLGEKASTAQEVLIAFRQTLRGATRAEQAVEVAAGVGVDIGGMIAIGKLVWEQMGPGPAMELLKQMEAATGFDFFDIGDDGSPKWKTPIPGGGSGGDDEASAGGTRAGRASSPGTAKRIDRKLGEGSVVVNLEIPIEVRNAAGTLVASAHISQEVSSALNKAATGKPQPVVINIPS